MLSFWGIILPMLPFFLPEDGVEPAEVRFDDVHVEVLPDGRRVRIYVDMTPFKQRPNIDVAITSPDGEEAASVNIVETMNAKMVFTMHLRGQVEAGTYALEAILFYDDIGPVDRANVAFDLQTNTETG